MGAVASSAGAMIAAEIAGKKSRAAPVASGVTAMVGSIATSLGGEALGRFARGCWVGCCGRGRAIDREDIRNSVAHAPAWTDRAGHCWIRSRFMQRT
jgi:hypothetical protein